MPAIAIHTIFSTKHRVACFQDNLSGMRSTFLGGCAKTLGCLPDQVEDSQSMCICSPRRRGTTSVAEFVKEVKRVSTELDSRTGRHWSQHHWQSGYASFSVSESTSPKSGNTSSTRSGTIACLRFRTSIGALRKHGETWDERYVWD